MYSWLWASFGVIIISSVIIVWRTAKVLQSAGISDEAHANNVRRIRGMVLRLMPIPLCYMVLHLPGE